MTKEDAINELQNNKQDDTYIMTDEAIDMAIKALSTEPCNDAKSETPSEDAISRKSVLAFIKAWSLGGWVEVPEEEWNKFVLSLPPVTPQPETAYWITLKDEYGDVCEAICSNCDSNGNHKFNYCPNCGRRMIEPKESEG